MADEFDMSFFQNRALDHGVFSPLSMMVPHSPKGPVSIVPLQVGVLQFPIPTARRCFRLGQALRRGIESYPEDIGVAIVATGGLSHQVHGERAGFNDPAWDAQFMDLLEKELERLTEMTHAEYAKRGGLEGSEVIMWLVMRGAMGRADPLPPPKLLPAVDGRHRDGDLRKHGCAGRCAPSRGHSRRHRPPARRHRPARRNVSVRLRAQRQGVSAQRLPASDGRAGAQGALPG
jgi:hypothetical protein